MQMTKTEFEADFKPVLGKKPQPIAMDIDEVIELDGAPVTINVGSVDGEYFVQAIKEDAGGYFISTSDSKNVNFIKTDMIDMVKRIYKIA